MTHAPYHTIGQQGDQLTVDGRRSLAEKIQASSVKSMNGIRLRESSNPRSKRPMGRVSQSWRLCRRYLDAR